jgi:uncharacterized Ntn-hydrolase superfamily protein
MTFTLVARCQRTGRLGIAIASELVSVGLYCDGAVRSHVGATVTQGSPHPQNNALALRLLAQGHAPPHVLEQLRGNDPHSEYRQVGIVDREGRVAVHTGTNIAAGGHQLGAGYVALGTDVSGKAVIGQLAAAFESHAQFDLEERLLRALEAARDSARQLAGSPRLRARSVALIVFGNQDYSDIDLRVDLHDEPIAELRRLFDEYQPFAAYYLERGKNPRNAITQREFADMLYASKAKEAS